MRECIGLGGFSLPIGRPGGALEASCFQDFGTQHLKTEASCIALRGLNQPVQCFSVSVAHDQNTGVLASDGDVQKQLMFDLMAVQLGTSTMQTAQNHRFRLGGDLVTVRALFDAQNAPVCPSQNIQRSSPVLQVVESLFFLRWINAVKEGGKVKRLHYHSTRYADFCTTSLVGLIPRDMPNSLNYGILSPVCRARDGLLLSQKGTRPMKHTRSQCPSCKQVFAGTKAFDTHRVGPYTRKQQRRRCLTQKEMRLRGMTQNEQGWWVLPSKTSGVTALAGQYWQTAQSVTPNEEERA